MEKILCSACGKKENKNNMVSFHIYNKHSSKYKSDIIDFGTYKLCSACAYRIKESITKFQKK